MRRIALAVAVLAGLAAPGLARTVEERLIAGLHDQGYVILEEGYTFLGRLRIVAENDRYHREIVVNPGTGEVLRDYAVEIGAAPTATQAQGDSRPSDTSAPKAPAQSATATVKADPTGGAGTATDTGTTGTASSAGTLGGPGLSSGVGPLPSLSGTRPTPTPDQSDLIVNEPAISAGQDAP